MKKVLLLLLTTISLSAYDQWSSNSNGLYYNTSGKSIGIGTGPSSSYKLYIYNRDKNRGLYSYNYLSTSSSTYGISTYNYNGSSGTTYGLYSQISTSGTGNKYAVYATTSGSTSSKIWAGYFNGRGYFHRDVEIGTNDNSGATLIIKRYWGDWIQFKHRTNTGFWAFHTSSDQETFHFRYQKPDGSSIYPLRLTTNNRVGVNTSSPNANLDVNGNMRVSAPGGMWISGKTGTGGITSSTKLTSSAYHPLIKTRDS